MYYKDIFLPIDILPRKQVNWAVINQSLPFKWGLYDSKHVVVDWGKDTFSFIDEAIDQKHTHTNQKGNKGINVR